jgi:23S rRNA (pseudouridine1915-N3)-methyltransferase
VLARLEAFDPYFLVLLDPRGKSMDSKDFAALLQRQCYDDGRTLAFVVGGPDGVSEGLRGRANVLLGLSPMTLPHDLARLFLTEQIYRGFTLIHGLPYGR